MSGSDKHQGPFTGELGWYEVGNPCTHLLADALATEAIVAGLRAGHVFISERPASPWLELTAEGIHQGQRAAMGDELRLPAGASLRLRCRVQGGTGNVLRLVSAQEIREAAIADDDFTYDCQVVVAGDTYWRAEIIEPPEAPKCPFGILAAFEKVARPRIKTCPSRQCILTPDRFAGILWADWVGAERSPL